MVTTMLKQVLQYFSRQDFQRDPVKAIQQLSVSGYN
jgi:hypothetical protein